MRSTKRKGTTVYRAAFGTTASPAGRSVTRHIYESSLEKAKEHLKTIQAKSTISERSRVIETVFASEKKDLGLQRVKF